MSTATQRFIGPYVVREALGQGGMGFVYRAEDTRTGKDVALKTVNLQASGSLAGIRREIQALARLDHPGVVKVLAHGVCNGAPWYAMELLRGRTLRRWAMALAGCDAAAPGAPTLALSESARPTMGDAWRTRAADERPPSIPFAGEGGGPTRTIPLGDVLDMARRLCEPLAYLHGEGVVHRDLKPDNVLVLDDGRPVLVDFGLTSVPRRADAREAFDGTVVLAGTVWYMAPEQAQGEPVDARADLYALGCMLYEILTGRLPYPGTTRAEVLQGHSRGQPCPPSRLCGGVPAALDELVARLMAKDPQDRVGHADDVAAALERLGAAAMPAPARRARAYLYRPSLRGRGRELGELRDLLTESLQGGRGAMAMIEGEAGSGKTRLAMTLAAEARCRGVDVLAGEALPPGSPGADAPLHPLRRPLQAVADRCREGGAREVERLLGHRAPVLALFEPEIQSLPGVSFRATPADLEWHAARQRIFRYVAETLTAWASVKPLLLVLDDLQWCDELTAGLLGTMARGDVLEQAPLLVLAARRIGPTAGGAGSSPVPEMPGACRIPLARLSAETLAEVTADMLAVRPAPRVLLEALEARAEGNPFYVAEYLRAALARGLLYRDDVGGWRLRAGAEARDLAEGLAVPGSIEELWGPQVEALAVESRRVLEAAAVLARPADVALLAAVASLPEGDALGGASDLMAHDALVEVEAGAYRTRDRALALVALDRMEPARKRAMHARAAAALEASGDRGPLRGAIADHHLRAGEESLARAAYLEAARWATGRYALHEAARHYRAALDLLPAGSPSRVEVRLQVASEVLMPGGRVAEAMAEWEAAVVEAAAVARADLLARARLGLSRALARVGRMDRAAELAAEALAAFDAAGDDAGRANALTSLARLSSDRGRLDEGRPLLERALQLHRAAGDLRGEAAVLDALSFLEYRAEHAAEAARCSAEALELHRKAGDRPKEGVTLGNLGILASEAGDPSAAKDHYERALAIAREVGDRTSEANTLSNLAVLHEEAGRPDEAAPLYLQALAIHREVLNRRNEGHTLHALGRFHRNGGRPAEAAAYYGEAAAVFREVGDERQLGSVLAELAGLTPPEPDAARRQAP